MKSPRSCSPTPAWTSRQLRAAANKRGFKPVPLDATVVARPQEHRQPRSHSRNVVGLLPGAERRTRPIVYMAHWDHLGTARQGDRPAATTSTTAPSTTPPAWPACWRSPKPSRGQERQAGALVLFLPVTLEESGLLGSKYYVAHPVIPLDKTGGGDQPRRDVGGRPDPGHDRDRPGQLGAGRPAAPDRRRSSSARWWKRTTPRRATSSAPTTSTSPSPACRRCTPRAASTTSKAARPPVQAQTTPQPLPQAHRRVRRATWNLRGVVQDLYALYAWAARWPTTTRGRTVRGQCVQGGARRHAPRHAAGRSPAAAK